MERVFKTYELADFNPLQALAWAGEHFTEYCFLNSNQYALDKYSQWDGLLALGAAQGMPGRSDDAFSELKLFASSHNDWMFGHLSYDLKNQLENLDSQNHDGVKFPLAYFFRPVILIILSGRQMQVGCLPGFGDFSDPDRVLGQIRQTRIPDQPSPAVEPLARVSRERYLQQVESILNHIQLGDVYEMNYCVEFYAEDAQIDPLLTYSRLNSFSPTPFSAFYRLGERYLLCASPERFIKKQGKLLISQPIKGTAPRGKDPEEDQLLRDRLYNDPKERSENVMIVDLVRNDLSRVAARNSVKVEELFGIYSFSTVHQMISTVKAHLSPGHHFTDALRHAFPMGSMTGAPKYRAMQLIEQYEDTRRGLYSGAVGYIDPQQNFDFNVVIRSILYNRQDQYLCFLAGSAITSASLPENEYQECLHKAKAMAKALA